VTRTSTSFLRLTFVRVVANPDARVTFRVGMLRLRTRSLSRSRSALSVTASFLRTTVFLDWLSQGETRNEKA